MGRRHEEAVGARLVKSGFATSKAMDAAFGLGFPSVRWITPDVEDASRRVASVTEYRGLNFRLAWPENVAVPVLRDWCRLPSDGPVTSAEVRELVARIMHPTVASASAAGWGVFP